MQPSFSTLLDEVTGLALNTQHNPMEPVDEAGEEKAEKTYTITIPFRVGSVVKYRYERQAGAVQVAEHLSDGSPVRYRMFYVSGPGAVDDVISRWTDTAYELPTGRIQGQATDAETGKPIPELLVSASGAQTLTSSDGSFMLEGLPPGVHNLVGYAMDGAYQTFQQGALVAEGSTTPTPIQLVPADFVKIVFVVKPPEGTPPVIPLRMAGNLTQLGNTFGDLPGGISGLAANMPALTMLPDGRYSTNAALPVGADIQYKYTLGDGFWNAERAQSGDFKLRQLIVTSDTVLVEDEIDAWISDSDNLVTFDVTAPADTPDGDFVSIQFNPLLGWNEPIQMWSLGGNRWAYVLYSPLNLTANFSYRYCRNNQCGIADDAQTPGPDHAGRPLKFGSEPQTVTDQIAKWADWSSVESAVLPSVDAVQGRGDGYWTGFETASGYRPSWEALLPNALKQIKMSGANHIVFKPTWSYGRQAPGNTLPILAPLPASDPSWNALISAADQARTLKLSVVIRPSVNFEISASEWWASASRDESWWQVWFEQYRVFVLHHADLAARTKAQALILGGDWLRPALPDGELADGSPSGVPADAEQRWRDLLVEVRSRFSGQLIWALSPQDITSPPPFIELTDRIYLELAVPQNGTIETVLGQDLESWLDNLAAPFQFNYGNPLILAAACPADPDLQTQVDCYQSLLSSVNARDWISGFISLGYFPAAAMRDPSVSVHGKTAEELLGLWFQNMAK